MPKRLPSSNVEHVLARIGPAPVFRDCKYGAAHNVIPCMGSKDIAKTGTWMSGCTHQGQKCATQYGPSLPLLEATELNTSAKVAAAARSAAKQEATRERALLRRRATAAAEHADAPPKMPAKPKAPRKAKVIRAPDEEVPTNSKGKRKARQSDTPPPKDQYHSETQGRRLRIIIFMEADQDPVEQSILLPHVEYFDFSSLPIAKTVNAVAIDNAPTTIYEWLCVFEKKFVRGALGIINMTPRGAILIYRTIGLTDAECPGLEDLIDSVYESVISLAGLEVSDGSDDEEDAPSDESHPATSSPAWPSSTPGSSQSNKRKALSLLSAEAGPSKKTKLTAAPKKTWIETEADFWDRETAESLALSEGDLDPRFR
ncbi:hypothetical protein C8J57DRAFT_1215133 [Mycena rebaudengoi]|nr:hypothetical protein C8J57DRAFT_1215133 [Mycena rebaudengoi]